MSSLVSLNTEEAGKKLSLARRYHAEILYIVLFAAIGFLYQTRENDKIKADSKTERISEKTEKVQADLLQYMNIDRKEIIRQNFEVSELLTDIRNILKENQYYLKPAKK